MTLKYAVDTKEYMGYATAILYDGICPFTGMTEEDYISAGFTLMNEDAFYAFDKSYETRLCGKWKEITKEEYESSLNATTPLQLFNDGFYMGEYNRGSVFPYYQKLKGRYFTSLQSVRTSREAILAELKSYIDSTATCYFQGNKEDLNANT